MRTTRVMPVLPALLAVTATLSLAPSPVLAQSREGGTGGASHAAAATAATANDPRREPGALAPLLEGVGTAHLAITTKVPRAQQFFDQGLRLSYAFNHPEALRAFKEAQRLDPACAMCWWGEALVLGPNINAPLPPPEHEKQAYAAIQEAKRRRKGTTRKEQVLIDALARRYAVSVTDRKPLDQDYSRAMADAARAFPDDRDVQTLYAEALMDLTPWDFWSRDGAPRLHTGTIVETLERVLAADPNHAGANHFLIHAVEASKTPERALAAADRLGALAPAAGHMVHMPAHIYIRTGFYEKAAEANVRAIAADESYIEQCRAQGTYPAYLYPHNIHFLWAASTFEGRSAAAIEAARKMASKLTHEHTAGPAGTQDWAVVPLYALVRFGKWDEVLREPVQSDRAYATAIRHWARGVAFANQGKLEEARAALAALEAQQALPEIQQDVIGFDPAARVLEIPRKTLAAEIAWRDRRRPEALTLLREAVALQDALRYNEPPPWHQPVRHLLGAALLDEGRAAEAEQVYRQDLEENRDNGWALFGLLRSLRAQGKGTEAAEVEARFRKAWSRADIVLTSSRF